MGDLELFFGMLIVVGVLVGVVAFASHQRDEDRGEPMAGKDVSMRPHRGINIASIAGEGLGNLPGLLITIAFVFMFFGVFLPRDNQWILVLFIATELGAAGAYIRASRRN